MTQPTATESAANEGRALRGRYAAANDLWRLLDRPTRSSRGRFGRLAGGLAHFAEHRVQGRDLAILAGDSLLRLAPNLRVLGVAKRNL